jgi:hypothetical protein
MNDLVTIMIKYVWPPGQLILYLGIRKKRYEKIKIFRISKWNFIPRCDH